MSSSYDQWSVDELLAHVRSAEEAAAPNSLV
jgi:hypothetical protein